MKHIDTESEPEPSVILNEVDITCVSSASEDNWSADGRNAEEAVSSASEGWSFQPEEQPSRRKAVKSLQFGELSKAPSVQELVEGAEYLVSRKSKCAIER